MSHNNTMASIGNYPAMDNSFHSQGMPYVNHQLNGMQQIDNEQELIQPTPSIHFEPMDTQLMQPMHSQPVNFQQMNNSQMHAPQIDSQPMYPQYIDSQQALRLPSPPMCAWLRDGMPSKFCVVSKTFARDKLQPGTVDVFGSYDTVEQVNQEVASSLNGLRNDTLRGENMDLHDGLLRGMMWYAWGRHSVQVCWVNNTTGALECVGDEGVEIVRKTDPFVVEGENTLFQEFSPHNIEAIGGGNGGSGSGGENSGNRDKALSMVGI